MINNMSTICVISVPALRIFLTNQMMISSLNLSVVKSTNERAYATFLKADREKKAKFAGRIPGTS